MVKTLEQIKEYQKQYRLKLAEIGKTYYDKEKSKKYYEANKEKKKEYREANKEKMKQYREENKERINESKKKYREANKDKIRAYNNEVIECECGGTYTRKHKSRHENTVKHQTAVYKIL